MPQAGQRANVRNNCLERAGILVLLVAGRGDVRRILRDGVGQRRDLRGLDAGQDILRRRAHQPVANGNGGGLNFPPACPRAALRQ